MTPQQAQAATLLAQPPTSAPRFDLAWQFHTAAGELACDAGEYVMKRRHRGKQPAAYQPILLPGLGFLAAFYARETWQGLPGPWPVKVALCAICLAVPGPQDEILLIAVTQFFRVRRARRLAR